MKTKRNKSKMIFCYRPSVATTMSLYESLPLYFMQRILRSDLLRKITENIAATWDYDTDIHITGLHDYSYTFLITPMLAKMNITNMRVPLMVYDAEL